ncbi:hypothetical protein ACFJGW_07490 [Burkholderiaceae bacterium UC74_6]
MRIGKCHRKQGGYGLVAVLILLALAALGLSQVSERWTQDSRRAKEQELLRVGQLYAKALTRYRDMSPGSLKRLPKDLDELLLDKRFVGTVRHLRELYADPVNHGADWILVRDEDGRIQGVRSSSDEAPLIQKELRLGSRTLKVASRYSEWQFLVDPPDVPQSPNALRPRTAI